MQLLNIETQQARETKLVLYLQHLRTHKSVHKKVQLGRKTFPPDIYFLDFKIIPLIFLPEWILQYFLCCIVKSTYIIYCLL